MAHFAEIDDNNIVLRVLVVENNKLYDDNGVEIEPNGRNFLKSIFGENTNWVQTSYNNQFRKHYAGIGYTYDLNSDVFIRPKPYPSWNLNENHDWQAPISKPDDNNFYTWNEYTLSWIII